MGPMFSGLGNLMEKRFGKNPTWEQKTVSTVVGFYVVTHVKGRGGGLPKDKQFTSAAEITMPNVTRLDTCCGRCMEGRLASLVFPVY